MVDRLARCNEPITLLGCMISAKNQNPLSRGGLKKVSKKNRDIQSPSQRRCEFKSADSRVVTKQKIVRLRTCFHLWQSVNENKCLTAARIRPKLLTKIYRIHDVWEFRR